MLVGAIGSLVKPYRIEDHPLYDPADKYEVHRRKALAALPSKEPYYSAGKPLREGGKYRLQGGLHDVLAWLEQTIALVEQIRDQSSRESRSEALLVLDKLNAVYAPLRSHFIEVEKWHQDSHAGRLDQPKVFDADDYGFGWRDHQGDGSGA